MLFSNRLPNLFKNFCKLINLRDQYETFGTQICFHRDHYYFLAMDRSGYANLVEVDISNSTFASRFTVASITSGLHVIGDAIYTIAYSGYLVSLGDDFKVKQIYGRSSKIFGFRGALICIRPCRCALLYSEGEAVSLEQVETAGNVYYNCFQAVKKGGIRSYWIENPLRAVNAAVYTRTLCRGGTTCFPQLEPNYMTPSQRITNLKRKVGLLKSNQGSFKL